MKYVALLRGINVGGNSKIAMSELKICFEELGLENVQTYINSGNVLFYSGETNVNKLQKLIQKGIESTFGFAVVVLVVTDSFLAQVINNGPKGFGEKPDMYHSDVAFVLSGGANEYYNLIETNPEVDKKWVDNGVIYYQRLSSKRTKSKMSKMVGKPFYKQMTIRTWNTVIKLQEMLKQM